MLLWVLEEEERELSSLRPNEGQTRRELHRRIRVIPREGGEKISRNLGTAGKCSEKCGISNIDLGLTGCHGKGHMDLVYRANFYRGHYLSGTELRSSIPKRSRRPKSGS
ncbi:uncharacterized protein LOC110816299 isoform X2 [Carica papaya]|uniref:uncharacterized protein LOC110816299 isoform X2 n=1 Tax=Carica papaya TaxID=3649 RepID=UPI000B8D178B|nr:uncharacterized protein LOC110816299 isoform X2 [Carica papaya]